MDIKGEERIPVPIQTVWEGLNSTDILLQAIPGCESIERTGENELQAKVMIKLGPVTARFSGKVSMSEIRPLEGYTLNFEGSGGAAGFAKGSAEIRLQDEGDQTLLTYNAKAPGLSIFQSRFFWMAAAAAAALVITAANLPGK